MSLSITKYESHEPEKKKNENEAKMSFKELSFGGLSGKCDLLNWFNRIWIGIILKYWKLEKHSTKFFLNYYLVYLLNQEGNTRQKNRALHQILCI